MRALKTHRVLNTAQFIEYLKQVKQDDVSCTIGHRPELAVYKALHFDYAIHYFPTLDKKEAFLKRQKETLKFPYSGEWLDLQRKAKLRLFRLAVW